MSVRLPTKTVAHYPLRFQHSCADTVALTPGLKRDCAGEPETVIRAVPPPPPPTPQPPPPPPPGPAPEPSLPVGCDGIPGSRSVVAATPLNPLNPKPVTRTPSTLSWILSESSHPVNRSIVDQCGICGGDGTSCLGCACRVRCCIWRSVPCSTSAPRVLPMALVQRHCNNERYLGLSQVRRHREQWADLR